MDKQKYQKELEVIDKAIDVCLDNGTLPKGASIECPKDKDFTNIQDRLREEGVVISQYTLQNLRDVFLERKAEGLIGVSIIELPTSDEQLGIALISGKISFWVRHSKNKGIREIYEEHYRYIKGVETEWEHEEGNSYSYEVNVYGKMNVEEVDLPIDELLSYYEECKDFLEYNEKWETCVEQLKEYVNREQGKIEEEFCQFVIETNNDKMNLTKEIKKISEEVFKEIAQYKEIFSISARKNLETNEIDIFEEEDWVEGYANLLDVLPPEQKENFKKYLINSAFKTFKYDLDEYVKEMFINVCIEKGWEPVDYHDWNFVLIQTERGFTIPIENELAIECTLENFKKIARIYNLNSTVEETIELAWDGTKKEFNEAECTSETFYHLLAVKEKLNWRLDFSCDSFFSPNEDKVKEALVEDFLNKMRCFAQDAYREFIQENNLYKEDSELLNALTTEETEAFVGKKKEVYQEIMSKKEVLEDFRNHYLAILEDNGSMIKKDELGKARSDLFFVDGMHHATLDAIRALEDIKKYNKLNVYNLALLIENERLLQKRYQKWQDVVRTHRARVKKVMFEDNAETDGGLRESINSELKKMETCLEEIKALINKSIALTNEVIK